MKRILLSLILLGLLLPLVANSTETIEAPKVEVPKLSDRQTRWMHALSWCESHGNPKAVNPKDRDGTPSYGLYQFKPSTFYYYGKRYGIDTSKGYKDAETQEAIVTQMILRNDVKWRVQFPGCVKKLGLPPKLSTRDPS